MKILLKALFLSPFFVSCASYHDKPQRPVPVQTSEVKKEEKKPSKIYNAVWFSHSSQPFRLLFKEVSGERKINILIKKGISQKSIPNGEWELIGFTKNKKKFQSSLTSKSFVFKMDSKSNTYGGSLILGCPEVRSSGKNAMKRMKFFNRYPFHSKKQTCEIVIGNDLDELKTSKIKNLKLAVGF